MTTHDPLAEARAALAEYDKPPTTWRRWIVRCDRGHDLSEHHEPPDDVFLTRECLQCDEPSAWPNVVAEYAGTCKPEPPSPEHLRAALAEADRLRDLRDLLTPPTGVTFGDALRLARENTGKSMGQLARHLGVSVTYVSAVERGQRPPLTPDRLDAIAGFGIDPAPLRALAANRYARRYLEAVKPLIDASPVYRTTPEADDRDRLLAALAAAEGERERLRRACRVALAEFSPWDGMGEPPAPDVALDELRAALDAAKEPTR